MACARCGKEYREEGACFPYCGSGRWHRPSEAGQTARDAELHSYIGVNAENI